MSCAVSVPATRGTVQRALESRRDRVCPHDARGMRLLWQAVLFAAWRDSFGCGERIGRECLSTHEVRACAFFRSRDLGIVAALSGLDGQAVRDRWETLQDAYDAAGGDA